MKLILVDPITALCEAWHEFFKDLPDVEIVNGRFEKLPEFDCMVSAANSFGLMGRRGRWRDYPIFRQPVDGQGTETHS